MRGIGLSGNDAFGDAEARLLLSCADPLAPSGSGRAQVGPLARAGGPYREGCALVSYPLTMRRQLPKEVAATALDALQ